jgi:hypothetical protein
VFLISVSQHALGTEHLLIVFAEELHFLVLVDVAGCHGRFLVPVGRRGTLNDWQSSQNGIVDRQVVDYHMMRDLVEWALYN